MSPLKLLNLVELMRELDAGKILSDIGFFSNLSHVVGIGGRFAIPAGERDQHVTRLQDFYSRTSGLPLTLTRNHVKRFAEFLAGAPVLDVISFDPAVGLQPGKWAAFDEDNNLVLYTLGRELISRAHEELDANIFLSLSPAEAELYAIKDGFGPKVAINFPGLAYEIDELHKCLALGRSTAATFHAVRCLESGLNAVAQSLSITPPASGHERNWANRIGKISEQVEARWPSKSGRMTGDARFYDEVIGSLRGMQNPYRNSTMHLDQVYTEADARHIIELVKGFIQKIASRMDENGLSET